ncbi:arsenate reductase (glutaredoxin) [Robiginitalea sp. M366]|uniref:arsenate reductase (glutaredoxin) n=1 Tax=Robiginitalea aestuariiviva TaxID=3036903 RepID=UPI00240E7EF2|nr:arsenate reductase (glutaredoxin) [Robiginitalea aestuariiviva]MDG1573050.1 arsenate reductase (glutaredoxin) [Robiginitalea aestuariiviva]
MITVYHNPRCRKSREALQWLEGRGIPFETVEYLKHPLSAAELSELLGKLGMEPDALVRKNEAIWKEAFRGRDLSPEEVVRAMAQHPKLMERPVVVSGKRAVVARPADVISKLIDQ